MDTSVRFPLNRSVSIMIDFEHYDNRDKYPVYAFNLQRITIDPKGHHISSVGIPRGLLDKMKIADKRTELFTLMDNKTYKVFYKKKTHTRVVVYEDGTLKFKGPKKSFLNEVHISKSTFSTLLQFVDKDFNRDDEKTRDNTDDKVSTENRGSNIPGPSGVREENIESSRVSEEDDTEIVNVETDDGESDIEVCVHMDVTDQCNKSSDV